jgi:hypothetical protein
MIDCLIQLIRLLGSIANLLAASYWFCLSYSFLPLLHSSFPYSSVLACAANLPLLQRIIQRNDQSIKELTIVLSTTPTTSLQCVTGRVSGADEVDDANVKVEAEADAADSADLTPELGTLGDGVITASPVVDDRVVSERLVGFEVCTLSTERNAEVEECIDRD